MFRGWIRAEAGMRRMMLAMCFAMLTFTAALMGGFLHATGAADSVTRANERSLLKNHVDVVIHWLLTTENIQLTWDDAVRAAGGQGGPLDTHWADYYFGQFLTTMVHADRLFLVKPDGTLVRAWREGKVTDSAEYASIADEARTVLRRLPANESLNGMAAGTIQLADTRWPVNETGRPLTRWHGGLVNYNGRTAMMTVISITPDGDFRLLRRTPNYMVTIRLIDEAVLTGIEKSLLLGDMRLERSRPALTADRNAVALSDETGHPLAWISWRPNLVGPMVRAQTGPLLVSYLLFCAVALLLGAIVIRAAMRFARELAASEAQAQHHALHDPMLGLPNRTHVMQRLAGMLSEITAVPADSQREQVLLAYIDLDHLKAINDSIGHHVGDDLLVQVVKRLREHTIPGDVLGRLASDEFVLLRRTNGGGEAADVMGRQIMRAFSEPFLLVGHSISVTASCGISWAPDHGMDARTLMRNADIALFRAKQRGRARYRRFTRDMDATIRWRQDMEIELRRAIAQDGLSMAYQPIVNIADGSIASFEALLRWNHRERGEIGPGIFVPLAEQAGLMPQLGDWVLRRVFADSHAFGNAEISVNLSPLQIVARDFLGSLKALIAQEGIEPSRFTFEITEGVLLDNTDRVMAVLKALQDMGFRIALDDFGTGYSSLAYLRLFQFDRIKIDRSFVQGIENDIDAQSILRAIVALGRTLRMKVVAEGVETLLQQQLVQAAGCQLIQGHLYWRALRAQDVVSLLGTNRVQNLRMAV